MLKENKVCRISQLDGNWKIAEASTHKRIGLSGNVTIMLHNVNENMTGTINCSGRI